MKIAICFCGQIRTGIEASSNIRKFIGDLFPFVDFFMHTWDISQSKEHHPHSFAVTTNGYTPPKITNTYEILNQFINCYDNRFMSTEIANFDYWNREHVKQYRHFSPQWYSWYKSVLLKTQFEHQQGFEYDVVVKTRPDIIFRDDHRLEKEIEIYLKNPDKFYSLNYSERVDDVFFLSSSKTMNLASTFILNTQQRFWTTNTFGEFLQQKGIEVDNPSLDLYTIYRPECLGIPDLNFDKIRKVDAMYYWPRTDYDRLFIC
jgi:hypothetical protein